MDVVLLKNVDYKEKQMSTLTCIETYLDKEKNYYGCFLIEPLEIGQGITLGNALRRTLLSDLTGFSITGVRINNLKHEFSVVEGLREDVLEVLLNLKEIVFKTVFVSKEQRLKQERHTKKLKGFLKVQGPIVVTAGMFQLPKGYVTVINPHQYICTLVDASEFYLEIDIESGTGYRLSEENRKRKLVNKVFSKRPSTLFVDSLFMPIRKVNYKIKLIHDTKGNIKESLNIEIVTNGAMTPKRAIQEALKCLIGLFSPLFLTPTFLSVSSKLSQKFYAIKSYSVQQMRTVLNEERISTLLPAEKQEKSN
jgi:DNA-directed RNA polymerase subunit alpha